MSTNDFLQRLSDALPFQRRSAVTWLVPASIGVSLGVAAGIGIGVLYAPRSGAETRKRLRQSAERAGERARIAAGRVRGELESAADEIRERSYGSEVGISQSR